jgi:quercetin 2,3-dioxygenase
MPSTTARRRRHGYSRSGYSPIATASRPAGRRGRVQDAERGALPLNADAAVLAGTLRAGETASLELAPGRGVYLVAASGSLTVNGTHVGARDGVAITGEDDLAIVATEDTELVIVDVAD